tara:strand:+ start:117 stop:1781 length:1665 start_codon:yes stop_codon:yes gene_type:complete
MSLNLQEQIEVMAHLELALDPFAPAGDPILNQYLSDGVIDVISTIIKLDPSKKELFCGKTVMQGDSDYQTISMQSAEVVTVLRSDGVSSTNLYPAVRIPQTDKYESTLTDSLKYRSKKNAGWYWEGMHVKVVPAPTGYNDRAEIYFIDMVNYNINSTDHTIGVGEFRSQTNVKYQQSDNTFRCLDSSDVATPHSFEDGDKVRLFGFTEDVDGDSSYSDETTGWSSFNNTVHTIQQGSTATQGTGVFKLDNFYDEVDHQSGTVEGAKSQFPSKYEYLVVMYAAIQALRGRMAQITTELPEMFEGVATGVGLIATQISTIPEITDFISEFNLDAGVTDSAESIIDVIDVINPDTADDWKKAPKVADYFDPGTIGDAGDEWLLGGLTVPGMTEAWQNIQDFIEDDDEEMADPALKKVQTAFMGYSEGLKKQIARWNVDNDAYQGVLRHLQQDLSSKTAIYTKKGDIEQSALTATAGNIVKQYSNAIAAHQTEVQKWIGAFDAALKEVQGNVATSEKKYTWTLGRMNELKAKYAESFAKMAVGYGIPKQQGQSDRRKR